MRDLAINTFVVEPHPAEIVRFVSHRIFDREAQRVAAALAVRQRERCRVPSAGWGLEAGHGRIGILHGETTDWILRPPVRFLQVIVNHVANDMRRGERVDEGEREFLPLAGQRLLEYIVEAGVDLVWRIVIHLPELGPGAGGAGGETRLIAERVILDILAVASADHRGSQSAALSRAVERKECKYCLTDSEV